MPKPSYKIWQSYYIEFLIANGNVCCFIIMLSLNFLNHLYLIVNFWSCDPKFIWVVSSFFTVDTVHDRRHWQWIGVIICMTLLLLVIYWQCVAEGLQTDDDSLLKCLIDLAESTPKFLRPQLENIFNFVLRVRLPTFVCKS